MKTKIFWIIPILSIVLGVIIFFSLLDKRGKDEMNLVFSIIPPLALVVTGYVLARSLEKLNE